MKYFASPQPMTDGPNADKVVAVQQIERYFLLLFRIYLGTFNFASGVNFFVHVWPQPVPIDSLGATYMHVTMNLGLFQLAKVIEILAGFCLMADVFVPFALVCLFPISVTVLIMDTFSSPLAHVQVSGARNFVFHALLLAAYGRHYLPLLHFTATADPIWRREVHSGGLHGLLERRNTRDV